MSETQPQQEAGSGHRDGDGRPNMRENNMEHTNKYDSHCTITGCTCDHNYCYRGWIDDEHGTDPCAYCRPSLHTRLHQARRAASKGYPQASVNRILTKLT